ncbi:MAG: AMP-binding protein [Hoylesella marshii]|uniref:AMP-binding protein n=1 Tax=Hoylesella marshii TaxID=189722 RepID=UPI003F9ECFEC
MVLAEFLREWNSPSERLLVHTSGSTGCPKPLWVEKEKMKASARITCDFLGLNAGDTALLCMPLDYIAGKMMVVRSLIREMQLIETPPSSHPLRDIRQPIDFAAMVPMQVYETLRVPEERERLRNIRHLIIGGGAAHNALSAELRHFPNAIWSTYGMTETLSHIALRRLNGSEADEWYTAFDTVTLRASAEGCLMIDAPLVCEGTIVTRDRAELSPSGRRFRILGRIDNVICSGGIKIQAEEIEEQLRLFIPVPYMITKRSDARFGEVMVMLVEGGDTETIRAICQQHLERHLRPRVYLSVAHLPLTETGKPNRAEATRIATEVNEQI